jgi:hypothetical protein
MKILAGFFFTNFILVMQRDIEAWEAIIPYSASS